jgi:hypothetical protein
MFSKIAQTENDSVQFFCVILCKKFFSQTPIFINFFDNSKKNCTKRRSQLDSRPRTRL